MVWIKIIASIMIVCATSLLGFDLATRLTKRRDNLQDFQTGLTMLESEINYSANPLDQALTTVGTCVGKSVGQFYLSVSAEMKGNTNRSVRKIFESSLNNLSSTLCLEDEDKHILLGFASTLGVSNKENQLKSIAHTKAQLQNQFLEADAACIKSKKMYQSFGVLSGLLLSVILF